MLLSLLALLLVAAAVPLASAGGFDGDLLRPLGIDAQNNQDALLSFDSFSVSTYSPRLALSASNSECSDCVHSVARHIIDSTLESIADKCANVSCPVLKQRCQWIEDHQAEFTGYLAVELRPFTDGMMYCYGNASCDHPGVPKTDISSALLLLDSSSQPKLLLSQVAAAAPLLEQVMRVRVERNQTADDENDKSSRISELARRIEKEEHQRDCHSCLRHGVKWVLKRSIKHVKAVCKSTTCPYLKHFCSWAKEHKEVVKGMVYAHVQPWKAASGYCAGTGSCHCGGDAKQSMRGAPFTMGDKVEREEKNDQPIIGGGDHDQRPHGPRLIGSIINKMKKYV